MKISTLGVLAAALLLSGCMAMPTPQVKIWKRELDRLGVDVQEVGGRNPTVAAWLGLLPMAGSIYNGSPGPFVVIDFLTYPLLGPLWNWKNQADFARVWNIQDAAIANGLYINEPRGRK